MRIASPGVGYSKALGGVHAVVVPTLIRTRAPNALLDVGASVAGVGAMMLAVGLGLVSVSRPPDYCLAFVPIDCSNSTTAGTWVAGAGLSVVGGALSVAGLVLVGAGGFKLPQEQ